MTALAMRRVVPVAAVGIGALAVRWRGMPPARGVGGPFLSYTGTILIIAMYVHVYVYVYACIYV